MIKGKDVFHDCIISLDVQGLCWKKTIRLRKCTYVSSSIYVLMNFIINFYIILRVSDLFLKETLTI